MRGMIRRLWFPFWLAGVRLYSGSVRARARAVLNLRCQATVRLDKDGRLIDEKFGG